MLGDIDEVVYSLLTGPGHDPSRNNLCVLGRDGLFHEFAPGKKPSDNPVPKKEVGYLEDLRTIGNHLYSCGAQGQVCSLRNGKWQSLDDGLFIPFSGKVQRCLLSIDGFSDQDIYTVGEGGAVWHWDGQSWSQLDCPTNLTLNHVLCTSTGDVYFCGDDGFLVKLTKSGQWKELAPDEPTENSLSKMAEFRGSVFVAADSQLLQVDGETVTEVKTPEDMTPAFLSLDAVADSLWCVGDEFIYRYDGSDWHKLVCPDNS